MAMNAFFKLGPQIGFTPDYYCLLRYYPFWGNEPSEYIRGNSLNMKGCYFVRRTYGGEMGFEELEGLPNTYPILRSPPPPVPVGKLADLGFSPTYDTEFNEAMNELTEGKTDSEISAFTDSIEEDPPYGLNKSGMKKYLLGQSEDITEDDVIKTIRWDPSFALSETFFDFYSNGEPAGVECVRIAQMLGFNYIILIGFDGGFKTDINGNVLPESWGINDPFNGFPYNAYRITGCDLCKTGEGIDERNESFWHTLLMAMNINDVQIAIYNCTPSTKVQTIPVADLDETVADCLKWV